MFLFEAMKETHEQHKTKIDISLWSQSNAKILAFEAPKKTRFARLTVLVLHVYKYVGCTRTAKQ